MAGRDGDLLGEAYAALDRGETDMAVERFEAACSQDRSAAALEGTHDGALAMPDGSIPASGRQLSTRVCEVARVEGDEIVSLHLYWDNVAFLRAVGRTG